VQERGCSCVKAVYIPIPNADAQISRVLSISLCNSSSLLMIICSYLMSGFVWSTTTVKSSKGDWTIWRSNAVYPRPSFDLPATHGTFKTVSDRDAERSLILLVVLLASWWELQMVVDSRDPMSIDDVLRRECRRETYRTSWTLKRTEYPPSRITSTDKLQAESRNLSHQAYPVSRPTKSKQQPFPKSPDQKKTNPWEIKL